MSASDNFTGEMVLRGAFRPASEAIAVVVPTGTPLAVIGQIYDITLGFGRTADTNIYTAGDVIGINAAGSPGSAIHTLAAAGPAGALMMLVKLELTIGAAAVNAGMANFRTHFYNAAPTAILDNAAFDLTSTDQAKHLGWIDLPTPEDLGSVLKTTVAPFIPFKLADGQTDFRFELETRGGYTPASGTIYTVRAVFARIG
jgi:hypothetical protein